MECPRNLAISNGKWNVIGVCQGYCVPSEILEYSLVFILLHEENDYNKQYHEYYSYHYQFLFHIFFSNLSANEVVNLNPTFPVATVKPLVYCFAFPKLTYAFFAHCFFSRIDKIFITHAMRMGFAFAIDREEIAYFREKQQQGFHSSATLYANVDVTLLSIYDFVSFSQLDGKLV